MKLLKVIGSSFFSIIHVTNIKNETESHTDVVCIFLILQSVPIGVPLAVSPNSEKLDLNRLKTYPSSGLGFYHLQLLYGMLSWQRT